MRGPGAGGRAPGNHASAGRDAAAASEPAVAARARRRLPRRAARALAALGGLVLMAGSVAGFFATATAFDERVPVVVAARDLAAGDVLAAGDLAADRVLPGSVPYLAWTKEAGESLAGLAVVADIPAGSLIGAHLLTEPSVGAFGDALEVVVPVDTSLSPSGVFEGDLLLLIDPGAPPSQESAGRPRSVIDTLVLTALEGAAMRLFVPPAEWVRWRALPSRLGASPMVLPVPLGGDAAELAAALNELWAAEHQQATAALHPFGDSWFAEAEPGELEVLVPLDLALSPSGVSEGDLALLVDPGEPWDGAGGGRPRSVLRSLRLHHYQDGVLGVWAEPAEWVWWNSLPQRLGAAPMVLRLPEGTDVAAVAADLDEQWRRAWDQG